jgi:hypothetical protein
MISTTTTTTNNLDKLGGSTEDSVLDNAVTFGVRNLTINSSRSGLAGNSVTSPRKQEYYPNRVTETALRGVQKRSSRGAHHGSNVRGTANWFKHKDTSVDESMLAVLNGINHREGIKMCMDSAGRWRIAWGQLQDGTRSRTAHF